MSKGELQWCRAIPGGLIYSKEVHVWRAFLDLNTLRIESLMGLLSVDELTRAGRFRFERDQKRFIVARGMLRNILGKYLGMNPHQLQFDYTAHGKPVLAADAGYETLHFNLSHSGPFALYAVSRYQNIGIDIESVRDDVAVEQITRRFFSPGEIGSLEKTDPIKRTELFFQYWTRKEAFLKALGEGISFPMEHCDVSLMRGNGVSPVLLPGNYSESPRWYGQDLFPGNGYAAAISVEGGDWELSCREYDF